MDRNCTAARRNSQLHVVRPMEKKPSGNGLDWEVSEDIWQNHRPDWQITKICHDLNVNDMFCIFFLVEDLKEWWKFDRGVLQTEYLPIPASEQEHWQQKKPQESPRGTAAILG